MAEPEFDRSSAAEPGNPSAADRVDENPPGLLSIILPTYNEMETIEARIRSILDSVGDPIEIIVIEDDSLDGTWKVVSELDDPRIKPIRRKRIRGSATAINRGIIKSRGELDIEDAEQISFSRDGSRITYL